MAGGSLLKRITPSVLEDRLEERGRVLHGCALSASDYGLTMFPAGAGRMMGLDTRSAKFRGQRQGCAWHGSTWKSRSCRSQMRS